MSNFEAELRLPAKQPYAYINIKVTSDSLEELLLDVADATSDASSTALTLSHANACEVVMGGGKIKGQVKQAPKPAPTPVATPSPSPQAAVFQEPNAEELIKQELGGKVVSETEKKPWEQAVTPAAQPWQKSQSAALADW